MCWRPRGGRCRVRPRSPWPMPSAIGGALPLAPRRTLDFSRALLRPRLGCRVAVPDRLAPPRLWRARGNATGLQSSALQQAATGSGAFSWVPVPRTGTRCWRTAGSR
jgi:hypothetical protein